MQYLFMLYPVIALVVWDILRFFEGTMGSPDFSWNTDRWRILIPIAVAVLWPLSLILFVAMSIWTGSAHTLGQRVVVAMLKSMGE